MKKLTKQIRLTLTFVWEQRIKLRAEGDKLWAESNKLRAEGYKLRAEGDKLRAEGYKLWAESDKLWAEGILRFVGNITLEWTSEGCKLETGDVFLNTPADSGKEKANE